MSDFLQAHGLQHSRLPCPSPTPWARSNSCPLSQWCQPTISSSVVPFSSCLQSFPAWGSFLMSQFFTSGGQSIGASVSASVLPVNIQHWFPAERMETIVTENWPNGITWITASLTQWNYEPCCVGPPKMDRSWWRVLTKHGALEKGLENHFSVLALRTLWTVYCSVLIVK